MADTFTSFWGLTKPEVGASRDSWGSKLNNDLDGLDALLMALQPIGAMTDFAGFFAPWGWLMCDGTVYPIATYPRLFAIIANAYGGDGVTTFGVPDTRGRMTAGAGATNGDYGYTFGLGVGQKLGDWQIPIAQANLPNTPITTSVSPAHVHGGSVTDVTGAHQHAGSTEVTGDHAHSYGGFAVHNGGSDFAGGPDTGFLAQNTGVAGAHSHNILTDYRGDHQHALAISADGVHSHTFSLGGTNTPLRVVPPMFGTTKIICCGPPSMQNSRADSPAPSALLQSPMRGVN